MSNVIGMKNKPEPRRTIGNMTRGEVGYAVPWAYNHETNEIDEQHSIGEKLGTASLRVECIKPGQYSLTFEEPRYKPIVVKAG